MTSKKTLVTGGAGFIGHHVCKLLLEEGREVRALIFPGEDTRNLDGLDLERVEGDIRDLERMREVLEGVDRVFHLAALFKNWVRDPRALYDANVKGSSNLLCAAVERGVEKVVYTSSIAGIGMHADGTLADEETAFNLWNQSYDYVRSKYVGQEVALSFSHLIDVTVVNPGLPMGPGDIGPTPTGQTLIDLIIGRHKVGFDGGLNVADVEDIARGHLLAEAKGRRGEKYLLTGHNLSIFDFLEEVNRALGLSLSLAKIPAGLVAGVGLAMEQVAEHVTGRAPLITYGAVRYASQRMGYTNEKARRELGYSVRPLSETIRRAERWFREHGYLR